MKDLNWQFEKLLAMKSNTSINRLTSERNFNNKMKVFLTKILDLNLLVRIVLKFNPVRIN